MPGSKGEDFLRNDAISVYDLFGHTLAQEPLPRVSYNLQFCRSYVSHYYYILSLFDPCLGILKKI